ncbi:uncharacterized protein LOC125316048 [Rhodamnia argentea]|uniref:Uncharacterized protein LOC125316048 n=1 Tax=Rhodamnia argentea TaxID=178133 RepID=A0ABM3HQN8_9MYRT|nr:uncharacterized protein LOC125316048 [Rhodamnia argentea]
MRLDPPEEASSSGSVSDKHKPDPVNIKRTNLPKKKRKHGGDENSSVSGLFGYGSLVWESVPGRRIQWRPGEETCQLRGREIVSRRLEEAALLRVWFGGEGF